MLRHWLGLCEPGGELRCVLAWKCHKEGLNPEGNFGCVTALINKLIYLCFPNSHLIIF